MAQYPHTSDSIPRDRGLSAPSPLSPGAAPPSRASSSPASPSRGQISRAPSAPGSRHCNLPCSKGTDGVYLLGITRAPCLLPELLNVNRIPGTLPAFPARDPAPISPVSKAASAVAAHPQPDPMSRSSSEDSPGAAKAHLETKIAFRCLKAAQRLRVVCVSRDEASFSLCWECRVREARHRGASS